VSPRDVLTLARCLRSASTFDEAHDLLVSAVVDGLPLLEAAEALVEWMRVRAAETITLEAS
jgi:hypothetical protein